MNQTKPNKDGETIDKGSEYYSNYNDTGDDDGVNGCDGKDDNDDINNSNNYIVTNDILETDLKMHLALYEDLEEPSHVTCRVINSFVCYCWYFSRFIFWFLCLMAYEYSNNLILVKKLPWYYLTHTLKVHTFTKGIRLKVNVIARLEFELTLQRSHCPER